MRTLTWKWDNFCSRWRTAIKILQTTVTAERAWNTIRQWHIWWRNVELRKSTLYTKHRQTICEKPHFNLRKQARVKVGKSKCFRQTQNQLRQVNQQTRTQVPRHATRPRCRIWPTEPRNESQDWTRSISQSGVKGHHNAHLALIVTLKLRNAHGPTLASSLMKRNIRPPLPSACQILHYDNDDTHNW